MGFRKASSYSSFGTVRYNSPESKKFLDLIVSALSDSCSDGDANVPSRTFAPSSMRCLRYQWFRLRGTPPDKERKKDLSLEFMAAVGTCCHERVQERLTSVDGCRWVDVEDCIESIYSESECSCEKRGYETLVHMYDPPVTFSLDGVVEMDEVTYVLEIKTCSTSSFKVLAYPKQKHISQIRCYCALLNIRNAMVVYQDRQFGSLKCFTVAFSDEDIRSVWGDFKYVQDMVRKNLAPDPLPSGDIWCSSSYCPYYKSCKMWGR